MKRLLGSSLFRNASAQLSGEAIKTLLTLAQVPVFSLAFGLKAYGIWIVLLTIPSYLSTSDLGISVTGAQYMIAALAKGDQEQAVEIFRGVRFLTTAISGTITALAIGAILLFPNLIGFAQEATGGHALEVAVCLMAYGFLGLACGVPMTGFRATQQFARGTSYMSVTQTMEVGLAMVAALATHSLLVAAIAMTCGRLAGWLLFTLSLRRRTPWLSGWSISAPVRTLRLLWAKAIATSGVTLGQAISLQGTVAMVAAAGGEAIVPGFSTARMLTRLVPQFSMTVNRGSLPLFAHAVASGNREHARRLAGAGILAALLPCAAMVVVLPVIGPWVIHHWSGGVIAVPRALLFFMGCAALAFAIWTVLFNLMLAVSQHVRFAMLFPPVSIAEIGVVFLLTRLFGVVGAGAGFFVGEAVMATCALIMAHRQGAIRFSSFREAPLQLRAYLRR